MNTQIANADMDFTPLNSKLISPFKNNKSGHIELTLRIISALILIPGIVFITLKGGILYQLFLSFVLLASLREWSRLSWQNTMHPICVFAAIAGCTYFISSKFLWALGAGSFAMLLALVVKPHIKEEKKSLHSFFTTLGALYLLSSLFSLFYLRTCSPYEGFLLLWIYIVIWASDTGAYVWGRIFKGPKLWVKVSPNKTWSGFIGGTLTALFVGTFACSKLMPTFTSLMPLFFLTMILSITSHLGDLLESGMKRYYGVKDAGNLIPGHGGVLDRLDSLFLVSIVAALIHYLGLIK